MKNIKFICVIAALIIAFTTTSFGQSATELLQSGRLKIQSQPTLFEGMSEILKAKAMFIDQGLADGDAKDYPAAIISFTSSLAVEIDFDNVPSLNDFTSLKMKYDAVIVTAYQVRGAAYYAVSKYDEAISDVSWSIENSPVNQADMYQVRALAYKQKKDYDKALGDFNMAIKLMPKAEENYLHCIEIFLERSIRA
jgi:tetratricopeptide (TPR) repeat protein